MLDHLVRIPAECDQLLCDLKSAVCAANLHKGRIDAENGIGVKRPVLSGYQLALINHSQIIPTVEIEHPDCLRDMGGFRFDFLLLSGCEAARDAILLDDRPAFIGQHSERCQIDAGGCMCKRLHGVMRLSCVGAAHMDGEMAPDFPGIAEQIRNVGPRHLMD